jgi:L-lactate dehydrogenase (cytochrome)
VYTVVLPFRAGDIVDDDDDDEKMAQTTKLVSVDQILAHNTPDACWLVIEDQVWDVSKFAPEHPGGASCRFLPLLIAE